MQYRVFHIGNEFLFNWFHKHFVWFWIIHFLSQQAHTPIRKSGVKLMRHSQRMRRMRKSKPIIAFPVIHKIATKHTFQHIISMLPSFAFFFLPNVVTLSRKDSSFLSFFSVDIVFDGEAISNSWLISLRAKHLKLAVQFRPRRDWNYRLTKMGVADYVCLHSPHPGSVHLDSF